MADFGFERSTIDGSAAHSDRGRKATSKSSRSRMMGTSRRSAATRAAPKEARYGLTAISTSPSAASTSSMKDVENLGKRFRRTVLIHGSSGRASPAPFSFSGPVKLTAAQ